ASGAPCGFPLGLKCPPALIASGALQSPFSWMWKPCPPGARPVSLAFTVTLSPLWVKVTLPAAVLPAVGASVAVAVCDCAAAARHAATTPPTSAAAIDCVIVTLLVGCTRLLGGPCASTPVMISEGPCLAKRG